MNVDTLTLDKILTSARGPGGSMS